MIGLIIAAGKQTRFKSFTPKALCEYKGKTLAEHNIKLLSKYCSKVYVVTADHNTERFKLVLQEDCVCNIHVGGLGSGDAILRAIKDLGLWKNDEVIICWGDTILDESVLNQVVLYYKNMKKNDRRILIPAVWETSPYVLLTGKDVRFSKYGDLITSGFHDLSIFIGNAYDILAYCSIFYFLFYDGYCYYYKHKHGNEFEFLDIFNDSGAEYKIYHVLNYVDKSFNTVEEYESVSLQK